MELRGMNQRIQKLRLQSVTTQPRISMERASLETDAYHLYEGTVSVPELRALKGDRGGTVVIRAHPSRLLLVETPEAELADVDTPAALSALTGAGEV